MMLQLLCSVLHFSVQTFLDIFVENAFSLLPLGWTVSISEWLPSESQQCSKNFCSSLLTGAQRSPEWPTDDVFFPLFSESAQRWLSAVSPIQWFNTWRSSHAVVLSSLLAGKTKDGSTLRPEPWGSKSERSVTALLRVSPFKKDFY